MSFLNLSGFKQNVYPTSTKLKQFKNIEKEHQDCYYKRLILNGIGNKHKYLKQINKQLTSDANLLNTTALLG